MPDLAYDIIEGEYIGEQTRVLSFPIANPHAPYLRYFDFDRAFQMVIDHCKTLNSERGKDDPTHDGSTLSIYRADLLRFLAYLDNAQRLPTQDVMLAWLGTLSHLKAITVNRYLAPVRMFVRNLALQPFNLDEFDNPRDYMQCMEWQKSMQAALTIKNPKLVQTSQAPLDAVGNRILQEDAAAIIKAIDTSTLAGKRAYALTLTAFATGLRINALTRISLNSLQQHSGSTWTVQVKDKRGTFDPVAIDSRAVHAIQAYVKAFNEYRQTKKGTTHAFNRIRNNEPVWRRIDRNGLPTSQALGTSGLRVIMQNAALAVGITLNPHDYRRTWASWARKLMDRKAAQKQMKHQSFGTTEGYMGEEQDFVGMNIKHAQGFVLWELIS